MTEIKEFDYYTIVLNKNNIVPNTGNSVLKYDFNSSLKFEGASMSLTNLNIFNSWFNISAKLGNNKFSYKWFDVNGILNTNFDVTITDGYYNLNDLNEVLQSILYSRKHYIVEANETSRIQYHIEFITNSAYYAIQLNCYAMTNSSSLYTKETTDWGWPSVFTTVQAIFSSTSKFNLLIGLENGTYPSTSDNNNHTFLSTFSPSMDVVTSCMLQCSMISQGSFANPDNILYSFTAGNVPFGSMIERVPPHENYVRIRDGTYQNFTIEIVDQEYRRVDIKDTSINIMLSFKFLREV